MFSLAGRILKELAPNLEKLSLMENKTLSMAAKIPTKHVIPTAMISRVSEDLNKLVFKDCKANNMFSVYFKGAF